MLGQIPLSTELNSSQMPSMLGGRGGGGGGGGEGWRSMGRFGID